MANGGVHWEWPVRYRHLFAVPGEIRITEKGIEKRPIIGGRKEITGEGATASYVPGLRQILVVGQDGTSITHPLYHTGQEEFIFQLSKHKVFFHGS